MNTTYLSNTPLYPTIPERPRTPQDQALTFQDQPPMFTFSQHAPSTPPRQKAPDTTRTDRIRIKTALEFGHTPASIRKKYGYTFRQIQLAKEKRLTPQKKKTGRNKPKIDTPTRKRVIDWWESNHIQHRKIPFSEIHKVAPPDLNISDCKKQAIETCFRIEGYNSRILGGSS